MSNVNATSTVEIDFPALNKLCSSTKKAFELTAAALLSEVKNAEVFPFETGNLQNESTYVDDSKSATGGIEIVSDTPYARRLYYHPEYNFNREYHSEARGEWYQPWLPSGQHADFATETFARLYRKENSL